MLYLIAKSFYPVYAKMARQTVWNDLAYMYEPDYEILLLIINASSEGSDEPCASAQSRLNPRCSHTSSMEVDTGFDQILDI